MSIFDKFKKKKSDTAKKQIKKFDEVEVEEKKILKKTKLPKNKSLATKYHGNAYKNLIRPIITEQASSLGEFNQYVFEVAIKSNKSEIEKAIETLYGVKPVKINTVNMRGKMVRYGRKFGKLKNWKKAIIILQKNDKLDVYEGV